jgi:hypothetical protein
MSRLSSLDTATCPRHHGGAVDAVDPRTGLGTVRRAIDGEPERQDLIAAGQFTGQRLGCQPAAQEHGVVGRLVN